MIVLEHVRKRYRQDDPMVFSDLNLSVDPNEFVLITGESGAGKTTLMKLLLREICPESGRISVFGEDIATLSDRQIPYYRRKIGIVTQDESMVEEKNVYENVYLARLAAGERKKDSRMVLASLFRMLGISQLYGAYPRQLSGGERQRVCLARALANYPPLLLADEPTKNLSPRESRELMQLFALIREQGTTVVVATHDLAGAAGLPYRQIVLQKEEAGENG